MKPRVLRLCAALILVFGTLFTLAAAKAAPEPAYGEQAAFSGQWAGFSAPEAASAALMEGVTGSFLFEKDADRPLPMASTTKIMTALVVLECLPLDETVTVPDEAVGVEGSSVNLKYGEELTVRDLLYGLMLASGNDAAVALAVHAGGSAEAFAGMMNSRAARMGLQNTRFVTPNGLHDPDHYTTARDLCIITREAMKNPWFRRIVSTEYYTALSGSTPRTFKNKNSLLSSFPGAVGVKTGYTSAAGRCLVFAAERDGMQLIGCVLNCRPMFKTASQLMEAAFDRYAVLPVVQKNAAVKKVYVENGAQTVLELVAESSIMALTEKGQARFFRTEVCAPDTVRAPVAAGQRLGLLRVCCGDELYACCPLAAARGADERSFSYWLSRAALLFVRQ